MQVIEAEYEIVTPMFIGGADPGDTPEIRPPSVKGALRFWWRALQWGKCLQDKGNNVEEALHELHRQEAELFGEAVNESGGGQGKILLKVKQSGLRVSKIQVTPEQGYLLGQGLYHFNDGVLRESLNSAQKFKVVLKLANNVDKMPIINTLMLFGLLGGLGSRSRKGWGSVVIRSLKYTDKNRQERDISIPFDKDSYKKLMTTILTNLNDDIPPFTAFSAHTRIDLSATSSKSTERLLTEIGGEMQMYRSYGRKVGGEHKVNGKTSEKNFKDDHDLVRKFADGKAVSKPPRRIAFGLPHNYFFTDKTKVDVDTESELGKASRRASPLIIHIHHFLSGESIAVQCLFIADFLPKGRKVQLKKGKRTLSLDADVKWDVITQYLDRIKQGESIL